MEKNKFQNENNGNNNVNNAQPTNTQKAVAVLKAIETGDQAPIAYIMPPTTNNTTSPLAMDFKASVPLLLALPTIPKSPK